MKILVLNYEYPPVGGGGGRACADLCQALAAQGHALRVLTTHAPGLARQESVDGYRVQRALTGRRSRFRASLPAMGGYILGGLLPGLRLIRDWQPDILHAHFAVPTGVLALALHHLTGTPYVLTAHLGDVPGGVPSKTSAWFRFFERFTPPIWHRAAAVVAVSEYTRQLALTRYTLPIEVIPNGVALAQDPPSELVVGDPPRLIFAGRFQAQKNLLFLIEALAEVRDLPWVLALYGDGPQRAALQARIGELDLENRIQLPGWVSSDEVWEALGASDVLVMPSLNEGLPVVAVQALAQGLALVCNRAGGLAELVQDGVNGRACDVGDEACYKAGLRWCLEDRSRLLELKHASRALAARYDIQQVAAAYEALFRKALDS
jgi:glycosyltransferase involved in cell wall biosynthesis